MRARPLARLVIASLVAATALSLAPSTEAHGRAPAPRDEPIPAVPVSVAIAQRADKGVVDEAWIDAQLAQAERLFGGAGIPLRKVETRALPERFAQLETRADRDALAPSIRRGVINVFVVESLRDVDDTTLFRMGVHWRPRKAPAQHYVIVAASAAPTTMAHEIGHFFGNGHSKTLNNLMSYQRSGDAVFLSEEQQKTSRSFCRLYLRIKELDPKLALPAPFTPSAPASPLLPSLAPRPPS
jgi:hypothetical protein